MSARPRAKTRGWLSRERALALTLIIGTALALYVSYRLVQPFLASLAWALALAVIAYPLHGWICRWLPRANLAAGASVVVVAVGILAPTVFVAERLTAEAGKAIETVKEELQRGRWRAAIENNPRLAPVLRWIEDQIAGGDVAEKATTAVQSKGSQLLTGTIWAVIQLLITLFALFYFFRDRQAAIDVLRSLVPLSERETQDVFRRVLDTIHATVYGTLVVATVQGALGGLMFWWLGLPGPLLWGVVMAVLAVIPILGAFVVWMPAAAFLALQGNWGKALVLSAWGGGVIALADNLLYPVLVGTKLRLHTLPVFFAIVGGLSLFGAAGLILGPVTLAITIALLDVWRLRTARGRRVDAAAVSTSGSDEAVRLEDIHDHSRRRPPRE